MNSNEDIHEERIEVPRTPHQTQPEKDSDRIALRDEISVPEGDEKAYSDEKVEMATTNASSNFGSNESAKDGESIGAFSNPHEALMQSKLREESQSKTILPSDDLSQQLETEESKVEEALKRITSPPLPPRADCIEESASALKSSLPPVLAGNKNDQAPLDRPQLPPRQVVNAETLHLKAPHGNATPSKSPTSAVGNSSSSTPPTLPPRRIEDPLDLAAQKHFLASTFKRNMLFYKSEDNSIKCDLDKNILNLKEDSKKITNNEIPEEVSSFWLKVIGDYQNILINDIETLHFQLSRGIPAAYRLVVWQLVSYAKSKSFDPIYETYLTEMAPFDVQEFENQLKMMDEVPSENVKRISNVLKAYLLFDPECEFSTDIAYIINMILDVCEEEANAFGLLVRLMKVYGLRLLFLPSASEIDILCYKFDRLVEEFYPEIHNHMVEKGVRSSMFLPGFFTTLFQKKLPTEIQPRIGDMVFLEGIDSIMRILATLLSNSRDHLLKMGFDDMLELLKSGLLDAYIKQNDGTRSDTLLSNECMDKLLQDSMMKVAITPKTMKKYSSEYEEIHRLDNEKEVQYKSITEKNLHLQKHVRKLENDYTSLNREHVTIANELVKNRLNIESVLNENNGYKLQILDLKKKLDSEKKKQVLGVYVPNDLKKDLEETMKKNTQVMDENLKLQDRISELERLIEEIKTANKNGTLFEYSNSKNNPLGAGWSGFKKVFK